MRAACALAVIACLAAPVPAEEPERRLAPSYSAASLVNSASNQPGPVAPNTIVSLYGTELAYATRALDAGDMRNGALPTVLPGTGVRVLVNSLAAQIYYVSPRQVNLLIPSTLIPGPAELQLILDGGYGPAVRFTLSEAAPCVFMQSETLAIATNETGGLFTREAPARPGGWLTLYGTGFGPTQPAAAYGELATTPAPLALLRDFAVLLDGLPVDPARITYAGLAPGFAGLYQVNLQLPDEVGEFPELRVRIGDQWSPSGPRLPVSR